MTNENRFKVHVYRYGEHDGCGSYFGFFVSEVYAIDTETNQFLVYDPGDYQCCEGFTWVDFTETMIPIEHLMSDEEFERVPIVTLVDEEAGN